MRERYCGLTASVGSGTAGEVMRKRYCGADDERRERYGGRGDAEEVHCGLTASVGSGTAAENLVPRPFPMSYPR
jgi:hypothetical protein